MSDKVQTELTEADRLVIAKKARDMERAELKAEAAQKGLSNFFKKAITENERNRQNIARQCMDGYDGKLRGDYDGEFDPSTGQVRRGKQEPRIDPGDLDKSITGYERYPWQEDDD
jgi:hypothetical protein